MALSETSIFRTKQEFFPLNNPSSSQYVIGLDIGYSGTKVFYEKGYFCFPSYARKLSENMLNISSDMDILYRDDETNEVYMVGYNAQNMMMRDDTNDTDGELYSRKRYSDKRFRILAQTAIGIALANKHDNRDIVIQTGLPSSYVSGDEPAIKKAFVKKERFSLRIGAGEWVSFADLDLKTENIYVLPQPAGALYSVLINSDGTYTSDARSLLTSNVLVMDVGFGTFDFFGIQNRTISCKESSDELGMREVFDKTTKKIREAYGEDVRVAALQKNLETGMITVTDDEEMTSDVKPIGDFLQASSSEVMKSAMEKAKAVTHAFRDYEYIIVDGGTGEAWYEQIVQWLSNMKTITVMPCNRNDNMPFIYANARGYYMYRYAVIAANDARKGD